MLENASFSPKKTLFMLIVFSLKIVKIEFRNEFHTLFSQKDAMVVDKKIKINKI